MIYKVHQIPFFNIQLHLSIEGNQAELYIIISEGFPYLIYWINMKYIIVYTFSLSLFLVSCTKKKAAKILHDNSSTDVSLITIPNRTVDKSLLQYNNKKSLWMLNEQPYSGFAVSYHQESTLKEKIGIVNGKKQNQSKNWYSNGKLKRIANYHAGKLHGEKKAWSTESVLLSHLNYQLGKPHGQQKTWYPTGELHKKLNLSKGREKGIQQAFRKNGVLYANYEAKKGRIFGLKKASLCFGLENENIQ